MSSSFGELVDRVIALTELDPADATEVAKELWSHGDEFTSAEIVDCARALGYDVERKHAVKTDADAPLGPDISFDPAIVLSEVYENSPRVLCSEMPKLGRAPAELLNHAELASDLEDLPEDIRAMLVTIDLFEGRATYWLRDEANNIDRPIGPIDLRRYDDASALVDALMDLFKRLPLVLTADFN
jgi:hypothetical protein